jgi:catechol 2,3-dioxygenase-like lactoylglutathione lyase family enzyme
MPRIVGFFEVGLRVKDLRRSEDFYCDALGLCPVTRDEVLGFLAVRAGDAVLRLQQDLGRWPGQRVAFSVDPQALDETLAQLRDEGYAVEGPFFHEWLPATSFQVRDPDGHLLELCTSIALPPRR